MNYVNTVIIGGGQAGLAMSCCLTEHGVDHVVLERGRIGERWRSERWDSLRLLTPSWQSRLPHFEYRGERPDEFMTVPEFVRHLERYAQSFVAPVETGTTVNAVARAGRGFRVSTDRGVWNADNVVVATGFCDVPRVPDFARDVSERVTQIVPSHYRNPRQVAPGGVLVVGASATGLQIAEELVGAGHEVTLAVGTHVRVPRRYRGRDVLYWMDAMGAFAAPARAADERASPPPQLIGTPEHRDLDLATLQRRGVRLTGRATGVRDEQVLFADDLPATVAAADAQMRQLLEKIDGFIASSAGAPIGPDPRRLASADTSSAPAFIDLRQENVRTVVWATGYERRYPWLELPVLDDRGEIRHEGGVTVEHGLYVLGIRFQRTKGSNLIDGVGRDAEVLARHLLERRLDRAA